MSKLAVGVGWKLLNFLVDVHKILILVLDITNKTIHPEKHSFIALTINQTTFI